MKESFQKHLKTGWVKANVVCRGRGFEGVTTPALRKILIIHLAARPSLPICLNRYGLPMQSLSPVKK